MGYSHYWSLATRPTRRRWNAFAEKTRRIVAHPAFAGRLCWEYDQPERPPQIDAQAVRFNGRLSEGYETFYFEGGRRSRGWCKTSGDVGGSSRSYDIAVCAVLIAAHDHLDASVSTDGEWFEPGWVLARCVYVELTGSSPTCPWPTKECASCGLSIKEGGHIWVGRLPCCPRCGGSSGRARNGRIRCITCDVPFAPAPTDMSLCFYCANGAKDDRAARVRREAHAALRMLRKVTGRPTLLSKGWSVVGGGADPKPVATTSTTASTCESGSPRSTR